MYLNRSTCSFYRINFVGTLKIWTKQKLFYHILDFLVLKCMSMYIWVIMCLCMFAYVCVRVFEQIRSSARRIIHINNYKEVFALTLNREREERETGLYVFRSRPLSLCLVCLSLANFQVCVSISFVWFVWSVCLCVVSLSSMSICLPLSSIW